MLAQFSLWTLGVTPNPIKHLLNRHETSQTGHSFVQLYREFYLFVFFISYNHYSYLICSILCFLYHTVIILYLTCSILYLFFISYSHYSTPYLQYSLFVFYILQPLFYALLAVFFILLYILQSLFYALLAVLSVFLSIHVYMLCIIICAYVHVHRHVRMFIYVMYVRMYAFSFVSFFQHLSPKHPFRPFTPVKFPTPNRSSQYEDVPGVNTWPLHNHPVSNDNRSEWRWPFGRTPKVQRVSSTPPYIHHPSIQEGLIWGFLQTPPQYPIHPSVLSPHNNCYRSAYYGGRHLGRHLGRRSTPHCLEDETRRTKKTSTNCPGQCVLDICPGQRGRRAISDNAFY